ncbi:hypothetical protein PCE1_004161 [Barthelona sp. PCE]
MSSTYESMEEENSYIENHIDVNIPQRLSKERREDIVQRLLQQHRQDKGQSHIKPAQILSLPSEKQKSHFEEPESPQMIIEQVSSPGKAEDHIEMDIIDESEDILEDDISTEKPKKKHMQRRESLVSDKTDSPLVFSSRKPTHGKKKKKGKKQYDVKRHADRLQHLARPKTSEYQRRAQQRNQMQSQELAECTFKPRIREYSNEGVLTRSTLLKSGMKHKNRVEERERQKHMMLESEIEKYSFTPRTNKRKKAFSSKVSNQKPIFERFSEEKRRKTERLHRLRLEMEEEEEKKNTFKPKISKGSELLASTRKRKSILAYEKPVFNSKKYKPQLKHKPDVNPNSKILVEHLGDFDQRMRFYDKNKRVKELQLQKELEPKFTFEPQINVDLLKHANHYAINETDEERIQRLYLKDAEHRRLVQKHLEKKSTEGMFKPKIDDHSREIGQSKVMREMNITKGKTQPKVAPLPRACTFKPEKFTSPKTLKKRSKYSLNVNDTENLDTRISEMLKRRKQKLQTKKQRIEADKQTECTFVPQQTQLPTSSGKPIVVQGFTRHIEQQDKARKLREAKEHFRKVLFMEDMREVDPPMHNTISIPPRLSFSSGPKSDATLRLLR